MAAGVTAMLVATVVDTGELLQTVTAAFVAGVGVTVLFSLAVLGAARFTDLSRDGRAVAASLFGVLAILGLLAVAVAIVVGVIVMTQK
jgi:hypothetical protein